MIHQIKDYFMTYFCKRRIELLTLREDTSVLSECGWLGCPGLCDIVVTAITGGGSDGALFRRMVVWREKGRRKH